MVVSWAVAGSDGEVTRSRVPKVSVNMGNSSAVAVPGIRDGDLLQIAGERLVKAVIRSTPDRPPEIDVVTAGQGAAERPGAASDRRAH
jgi:hypothetical protein